MTMLRKYPVPANFYYPSLNQPLERTGDHLVARGPQSGEIRLTALQDDVLMIENTLGRGEQDPNPLLKLHLPEPLEFSTETNGKEFCAESWRLTHDTQARTLGIYFGSHRDPLLTLPPDAFGFTGNRRILLMDLHDPSTPVYGLGEKTGGLDKARTAFTFWNVDVVADHPDSAHRDNYDPGYVSIPFLITRREDRWYGILLASVGRSWIHTGMVSAGSRRFCPELGLRREDEPVSLFSTEDEPLRLLVLPGDSLAAVVRKFTRITGTHPRPPRWSLGYHQCRWGYRSVEEFQRVANRLAEARIPVCALWLDIDYMDGWRVFTWDPKHFPDGERQALFDRIRSQGTRVVTIVDPGIKREPGNPIHDEFHGKKLLCTNEEGIPYTGTVWPGATVFPDFTLPEARQLWASHITDWARDGIDGIWNDMNDPSTGPITDEEMRFDRGRLSHNFGHNAYADLMAMATLDGLQQARPGDRHFILTRSGMTGIQRYAAVWTGDNFSNVAHLKMALPQTLNLGLSGVAFNGPDVGGFCDDTTEALMVSWTLAGFLFPFFRNHSASNTRQQEPYMFGPDAEATIRKAIQTRLKLMPVLDALFAVHEAEGDPVLRPLCYEFPEADYGTVADQYLLGSSILGAPLLDPAAQSRTVLLPPGHWMELATGTWHQGPTSIHVHRTKPDQPILFIRDGTLLPTWEGTELPADGSGDGRLDVHVFLRSATEATGTLVEDDGISLEGPVTWRELQLRPNSNSPAGFDLQVLGRSLGYGQAMTSARLLFHGWAPEGSQPQLDTWPFHFRQLPALAVTLPA